MQEHVHLEEDELCSKCWRCKANVFNPRADVPIFFSPPPPLTERDRSDDVPMFTVPSKGKIVLAETYNGTLPPKSMRPICQKCSLIFVLERSGLCICAMCNSWNGRSHNLANRVMSISECRTRIEHNYSDKYYQFKSQNYPEIKAFDNICMSCVESLVEKNDCVEACFDFKCGDNDNTADQWHLPGEETNEMPETGDTKEDNKQDSGDGAEPSYCSKCSNEWNEDHFPEGSDVMAWACVTSQNTFSYGFHGGFQLVEPKAFDLPEDKIDGARLCNECLSTMKYEPLLSIECDVCHKKYRDAGCGQGGHGCAATIHDDHIRGFYGSVKYDSFGHQDDIPFTDYEKPMWLPHGGMICDTCIDELIAKGVCQISDSEKYYRDASPEEKENLNNAYVPFTASMPPNK